MRFAPKTWVLWHDNLGTAMQKVGWVVAGFKEGENVSLTPSQATDHDLRFLQPNYDRRAPGETEVYLCALPNPNGRPYLIRPATNRMLPMPASKQNITSIADIKMDGGQRIEVRSKGATRETTVTVDGVAIQGLTKIMVEISADKAAAVVKLEGSMPDLSLTGRILTVETDQ